MKPDLFYLAKEEVKYNYKNQQTRRFQAYDMSYVTYLHMVID